MKYLIAALLLLSSCTVYEKMREAAVQASETLAAAKETVAMAKEAITEAKVKYAEAKTEADANKDGDTTPLEWYEWLTGGGLLAWVARERIAKRNALSDVRKDKIAEGLNDHEQRLAALETK